MKINLLVILFFPFFYCNAQIDTISLRSLGLRGNVKSITEYTFLAKDSLGYTVKDRISSKNDKSEGLFVLDDYKRQTNFKYEYSKNGDMLSKINFYSINSPHTITEYIYNSSNYIIREKTKMIFSDTIINVENLFKYTSRGLLESKSAYRNSMLLWQERYQYENDVLSSRMRFDNYGNLESKILYIYTKGYLTEQINDDNDDVSLNTRYIYEYDNNGNKIKHRIIFNDGEEIYTSYVYDNKNNLVKILNSNKTYTVNSFSDDNYILEKVNYNSKSNIVNNIEYKYNSGILSCEMHTTEYGKEIIDYDMLGLVKKYCFLEDCFSYDIFYDSVGNWINIIEYKNGIPLTIRDRILKYH